MDVFSAPAYDNHEQVIFCRDESADLQAIIAIHNTALGPGLGGCRMRSYTSEADALHDVLRLSRAMSYKNALAGLPLGGAKSVIFGDPETRKTPALLRAFGAHIQRIAGQYYTAPDIGMNANDMARIATSTDYVTGVGDDGDPAPFTAHGVLAGIRAARKHTTGSGDLSGVRVAVQGTGGVGHELCLKLNRAGADLVISDAHQDHVARTAGATDAAIVNPDTIYDQNVDIFAPCAVGAILNDNTIPRLKADIVAGAANNQLAETRHDDILRKRGILYAPDYVINAGGVIHVGLAALGQSDNRDAILQRTEGIYDTLLDVFATAGSKDVSPGSLADVIARQRIADHQHTAT